MYFINNTFLLSCMTATLTHGLFKCVVYFTNISGTVHMAFCYPLLFLFDNIHHVISDLLKFVARSRMQVAWVKCSGLLQVVRSINPMTSRRLAVSFKSPVTLLILWLPVLLMPERQMLKSSTIEQVYFSFQFYPFCFMCVKVPLSGAYIFSVTFTFTVHINTTGFKPTIVLVIFYLSHWFPILLSPAFWINWIVSWSNFISTSGPLVPSLQ